MEEPPTLTTIPVELLASIAECANTQDLLSLRLVNREVSAGIDSVFLQAFFAKRTHVFTRYGLQTLADITAQAHFARRIDHLTFVVVEGSGWGTQYGGTDPRIIEHYQQITSVNAALEQWEGEQSRFQESSATALLTQIFRALASSGKRLSLAVTDSESFCESFSSVYGYATLARGYEWAEQITGSPVFEPGSCDKTIEIIFQALSRSQATVKHIDLCHQDGLYGVRDNLPLPPSSVQAQLMPIWQALTVLKIGFLDETDYFPRGSGYGEGVIWMLQCMVSLRELELRNTFEPDGSGDYDWGENNAIRQVGSAVPVGHLRRLALSCLHAKPEYFVGFFSRHGSTLENLSLGDVSVPYAQDWSAVIDYMKQSMHLQQLKMHSLYSRDDASGSYSMLRDAQRQRAFAWHGYAAVHAGLEALGKVGPYYSERMVVGGV